MSPINYVPPQVTFLIISTDALRSKTGRRFGMAAGRKGARERVNRHLMNQPNSGDRKIAGEIDGKIQKNNRDYSINVFTKSIRL